MDGKVNLQAQKEIIKGGEIRWAGFTTKWYFIMLAVTLIACYMKAFPGGWLGGFAFATLVGVLLEKIGDNTPIIKDYFGGGAIVIIFGCAALAYFKVIPDQTLKGLNALAKDMDYLGWVVGGLICGSILGMDRKLLIKSGLLYFIPITAGIIVSFGLAAIVGMIIGFSPAKAVMLVAMPIMGGGTAAGAVPLSQIYGSALGDDPKKFLSLVMPAVALGNALSIVGAGLLDKLGRVKPSLTGNGELMVGYKEEKKEESKIDIQKLGVGFLLTAVFYSAGKIFESFVPLIHYYAFTIVTVAVVRILDLLPEEIVDAARQWYAFIVKLTIPAILVLIGAVYTDMAVVAQALTWQYLLLCVATVAGAIIGAGFMGKVVKFYFIESAITAGLCMSNMGGSGDIATLGAAKRMNLMPFAQISSRLGGAYILVISSILVRILGYRCFRSP